MNIREGDEFDKSTEVNIVPMIDVIFALLTFFMISSLYLSRAEGLPVDLPQAKTAQSQQQQSKITLTINPQGQVFVDRQPIEIKNLAATVESLKRDDSQIMVVINADRTVDHGQVITVMDELRTVKGVTLGIATERP